MNEQHNDKPAFAYDAAAFGVCPTCRQPGEFYFIGRDQYLCCFEHGLRWRLCTTEPETPIEFGDIEHIASLVEIDPAIPGDEKDMHESLAHRRTQAGRRLGRRAK